MQELKTINVSAELSKPRGESWDLVARWIGLLALHFRAEMSEPEILIYCESLGKEDPELLTEAMQRCLNECEFMPKLKEIRDKMPEGKKHYFEGYEPFVAVTEYFEPYSDSSRCHVWEDKDGNRRVKIEPKQVQ